MVRRGEYLERAVVFEGDAGPIEGLYHRGQKAPPLLVLPHEMMEAPIVAELAYQATRDGHSTLRINYRGIGASGGAFFGIEDAVADAHRAMEHLALTTNASQLALLGVGFGAEVALRLAEVNGPRISLVVLVSPAVARLASWTPESLVVVFSEEEARPQKAELDALRARPGVRIVVIPGADQRFLRGLVELGRVVQEAVSPPQVFDPVDPAWVGEPGLGFKGPTS